MQSAASAPRLEAAEKSSWLLGGGIFVLCAAIAKLAIHLYATRYAFFRRAVVFI